MNQYITGATIKRLRLPLVRQRDPYQGKAQDDIDSRLVDILTLAFVGVDSIERHTGETRKLLLGDSLSYTDKNFFLMANAHQ